MADFNTNNLAFGFSGIAVADLSRKLAPAFSPVVGALTANVTGELVSVMGGASPFPIASVKGRADGAGTITLNERPDWVEEYVVGMTKTEVGTAESSPYTLSDVGDGDLSSGIEISKAGTADPATGTYIVSLTAVDAVRVIHTSGLGTTVVTVTALTTTDKAIGTTGLQIKLTSSAPTSDDVGSSVMFNIVYGGTGSVMYSMPASVPTVRATLTAITKNAGRNHGSRACEFADVSLSGANLAITDNEYSPTEISFVINTPDDGSAAYRYYTVAQS